MAKYNEILVGRFNRAAQKLFGIKGDAPVSQASGDVQVIHPFRSGRENLWLEGWDTFWFTRAGTSVGGITNVIRLRNPVGSNTIAVFERICYMNFNVGNAPVLRSGTTNNDLPTVFVVGNKRMDTRGRPDSGLITSENSGAGGALLQARMSGNTGPLTFFDFIPTDIGEIMLMPGDAIEVDGAGVGGGAGASTDFLWRERFLEDSEVK